MERSVCIHGHFYQPPRENPWLDWVELQDSAYPYHDWNERITAECYAPNSASRILGPERKIHRIVNNYARISFNFGPTLLRWMETRSPETYAAILEADKEGRERHGGHGPALAQVYNHMILPLANRADKKTQVLWGIADFERRFGRKPEGMWLAESAVDLESLELMAEQGVAFTILAPHQASRFRTLGSKKDEDWQDVSGGRIDPTRPYLQMLPSGKSIAIFFYDGPVSRAVAFERLLENGETFAARLTSAFSDKRDWPELVHIATDGETYGHHHRHGEMALTWALDHLEKSGIAVTIYGAFLEKNPPTHEVQILERTSWSCAHGIERWKSDCGCNSGGTRWNQKWRAPLRAALDGLRDALRPAYEKKAESFVKDPWLARDEYVELVLDRSSENRDAWLAKHEKRRLSDAERVTVLELLEVQRHAMLMYTSCGWFFDELSGLETVQVLQYAGCAVRLAEEVLGSSFEAPFVAALEKAPSNLPEHGNGKLIYEKWVKPAAVDLEKVAAHYAVSSLFQHYGERASVYTYDIERQDARLEKAGKSKLTVGWVRVTSTITGESADVSYGALHMGDHNITAGIRLFRGFGGYKTMLEAVVDAFARADLTEVIRLLGRDFLELTYSMKSLFKEEQRTVLSLVLESTLKEAEAVYRQLYEHHAPLLRFLTDIQVAPPKSFLEAAAFVLNAQLRRAFTAEPLDVEAIKVALEEARRARIQLDGPGLAYAFKKTLERIVEKLADDPSDLERLERLSAAAEIVRTLPFEVDLWKVQNVYWALSQRTFPDVAGRAPRDEAAKRWVSGFLALGASINVKVAA